ncbi:DUF2851 family protein [Flavihumibacter sp. UBA7668]|uniref:DUF2851 family protein n=1 Tax=Flavihumibacter sp. UBA7668 TaxID=1946542 RepID=UPI0025C31FE2|nr:DUF2851 family protein [Flavihumibacter sp. UBA7668]
MKERLLQFIWQEKFFQLNELKVETGEKLTIRDPGTWNHDQGPDFLNARILLHGTLWAGHVEIHVKSSQWYQHRHQTDPSYNNVILHVVWENDDKKLSASLPTLVLQHRVSTFLLDRYEQLMQNEGQMVCQEWLPEISAPYWQAWKQELILERLHRKANELLLLYKKSNKNWNDASWWWMARYMGGVINGSFFEQVAQSLPTRILSRHKDQVIQLEAMLLGQANLLNDSNSDPYVQLLQREFEFLQHKYQLPFVHGRVQKLRMRPAAFPEIRLAQLAMLIHRQGMFSRNWLDAAHPKLLAKSLDITANDFWHYHFTLDEAAPYYPKHMGEELIQQLLINVIIPYIYAVGMYQKQPGFQQKAVNWLGEIGAEKNALIKQWQRAGVPCGNALESQALIELKKYYCQAKRCLDCSIGRFILNQSDGNGPPD